MKLGVKYKITVEVNGRTLTFLGTIQKDEDGFVTFIDKYGSTLTYNKNFIISFEEVGR